MISIATLFFAWVLHTTLFSEMACFMAATTQASFIYKFKALRHSEFTKTFALIKIV